MDFLDSLNPEQREAVLYTDGPLLILAGAGSGKTRVIAYRVAYLVGSGLADSTEVLAVTFTNKAAEEMRDRVQGLLGASYGGLWISTFHALCARLLRREAAHIGLSRDFVIYDSSDQLSAVKQILREQHFPRHEEVGYEGESVRDKRRGARCPFERPPLTLGW